MSVSAHWAPASFALAVQELRRESRFVCAGVANLSFGARRCQQAPPARQDWSPMQMPLLLASLPLGDGSYVREQASSLGRHSRPTTQLHSRFAQRPGSSYHGAFRNEARRRCAKARAEAGPASSRESSRSGAAEDLLVVRAVVARRRQRLSRAHLRGLGEDLGGGPPAGAEGRGVLQVGFPRVYDLQFRCLMLRRAWAGTLVLCCGGGGLDEIHIWVSSGAIPLKGA